MSVEAAFRTMKSDLVIRPIYHRVKQNVLCGCNWALLGALGRSRDDKGLKDSWRNPRQLDGRISPIRPCQNVKILNLSFLAPRT